jgi:hypothetical protein
VKGIEESRLKDGGWISGGQNRSSVIIQVLERGRFVESGSWRELMETNGHLAGVWTTND